ncbi:MAG TPA: hypothetical protein VKT71_04315 [Candidatus Acidoferrales bacterium]|nr:hypothetical protein [Candidatus Acidoferrales bacterium]
MIGILVCGNNHFIVEGPPPDYATAVALARHWSLIQINQITPPALQIWSIVTKAFRENLEWAVVVSGDGETTPAVVQLLKEISARGVAIRDDRQ